MGQGAVLGRAVSTLRSVEAHPATLDSLSLFFFFLLRKAAVLNSMGQQPHCHLLKEELRLDCLYYLFLYFFSTTYGRCPELDGAATTLSPVEGRLCLVIRMDALPMACKSFQFYYFLARSHFFALDGAATTLSPVEGGIAA